MTLRIAWAQFRILRGNKSRFAGSTDYLKNLLSDNFRRSVGNEQNDKDFHSTPRCLHGEYEFKDPEREEDVVNLTVINKDGTKEKVRGKIGDNLLYLSKRFEIAMEGACEASLACTTCHVYVDHEFLDMFPEPTEKEEDLLDGAPFLKENSRLGCQLILQKEHNGLVVKLPAATKNFYVDGHKPTAH